MEITEGSSGSGLQPRSAKLLRYEMQGQLFSDAEVKKMTQTLQKVPLHLTTDTLAPRHR